MRRALAFAAAPLVLVLAGAASAHVLPSPNYVTAGEADTITLDAPNERTRPMTSLVVRAPKGVEIVHAHGPSPWQVAFTQSRATWTGGAIGPGSTAAFGLVIDAKTGAGSALLDAEQHYADGGVVRWPVGLTVLPAKSSPSENLTLAAVIGLIGLLLIIAIVVLVWRRRSALPAS